MKPVNISVGEVLTTHDLMNSFSNYSLLQRNEDRQRKGGEGRKEVRTVKEMKEEEKEK